MSAVEVLSPADLRARFREECRRMSLHYQSETSDNDKLKTTN